MYHCSSAYMYCVHYICNTYIYSNDSTSTSYGYSAYMHCNFLTTYAPSPLRRRVWVWGASPPKKAGWLGGAQAPQPTTKRRPKIPTATGNW